MEIRSLSSPPPLVKLALEGLLFLLTGVVPDDWKTIRQFLVKEDFIQSIVSFETEKNVT